MEPVTTSQIYWGAIPFVCIQIIMVALIIAFPDLVSVEKREVIEDTPLELNLEIDSNSSDSNQFKFSTDEPSGKK